MAEPFLAEIRIVGFNFAPRGFATCDGQLLPINQNQALYAILGTTYGGNGTTVFALPDLRCRTPVHIGSPGPALGQRGGEDHHQLSVAEMPAHRHSVMASADLAANMDPSYRVAATAGAYAWRELSSPVDMSDTVLRPTGGGLAHENMSPFLVLNFVIALQGTFPSPS